MERDGTAARPYIKLMVLVAALGIVSGVITFVFMWLVHQGQVALWQGAAARLGIPAPLFTLVVCTLGGLLVGVCVRIFGDFSGIFAELMAEFGQTGRFHYNRAPGIVVTAFVSLIAGGSLGPEAPLADACGSLGTWFGDMFATRLQLGQRSERVLGFSGISAMLAAFITSPFGGAILGMESTQSGFSYQWTLFPSLVASAFATVTFVLLSGSFFGVLYAFPDYSPRLIDLLMAVPLGLIGAVAGALFIILFHWLRKVMKPLQRHLILRGLLGGIGLGIAGALLPLTLFSGEEQMIELIAGAAEVSAVTLILLALVKLTATTLCLATGWKGGYIFPVMFTGAALGLAIHQILPVIPVPVAVAATMAGAMVATMKAPIFSALFVMTLVQHETSPVIAIAVIVGALATLGLSMTAPPKWLQTSKPVAALAPQPISRAD